MITYKVFTLDMVAMARMTLSTRGVVWNCDSNKGSMVHTSPRLPEKMHRDSLDLSPIVRLMESSNTDPPLSLITAIPG